MNLLDRLLPHFLLLSTSSDSTSTSRSTNSRSSIVGIILIRHLIIHIHCTSTCTSRSFIFILIIIFHVDIELPPLKRFPRINTRHNNHKPLNVPIRQPMFHLPHHILQISQQTLIGGGQYCETVFGFTSEGFGLVDSSLVEDGVYRRVEEFGDDGYGPLKGYHCFSVCA